MFLCCYANKEGYLIFSNPKTTLCVLIHHPEFPKFTVRRSLVTVLLAPIYFFVMHSSFSYWSNFFCRNA